MTAPAPATVIVASYGRPGKIRGCLETLLALDYPDLRIIVVDDGSPVPIAPIAEPLGPRIRVLRQQNAGPAAARNAGVAAAQTDLIAFTDDDCAPAPDWMRRLGAAHAASPDALIGGRMTNALTDNVYSAASQGLCDYLYAYYQAGRGRAPFFTTNNMAFSRAAFLAVGGLDPKFRFASEDRDFGMRWRSSGRPLVYAPDAVVAHAHDLTLSSFWRQHMSYGAGARRLHLTMDDRGDPRPKVEPFGFYSGILLHPFRSRARRPIAQSVLMGLSQVAMVAGYFQSWRRSRRPALGAPDRAVD